MSRPVFRFAPSPNGYLHLGHARSALLNSDLARASGGRLLLRIEDIDPTRCRDEFEAAILEDVAWLGIVWEQPVRRQSEHLALYGAALARLEQDGLIYPAFETRAEIARLVALKAENGVWPRDPDGAPLYPRDATALAPDQQTQRRLAGHPHVLRLNMAAACARTGTLTWQEAVGDDSDKHDTVIAQPQDWGDMVLARKETPTSYHLSVVIDDALQGVTDVVRGQDLFWATSVHRLLQTLLDLPAPRYRHHALICGTTGAKLSKSAHATSLRELRSAGHTPDDIRRMVGLPVHSGA